MVSNSLLSQLLVSLTQSPNDLLSFEGSDYFRSSMCEERVCDDTHVDTHPNTHTVSPESRRSAKFGLSSSDRSSQMSVRDNLNTPCLSLGDPVETHALDPHTQDTHTPLEETHTPQLPPEEPHVFDDLEIEMEKYTQTSNTVSQAEARYNPHTWQMLCVIKHHIERKSERLKQTPETTYISFHELVPPHKCQRSNAVQALYQILLLLTLNDLKCEQHAPFGEIKLSLGPTHTVSMLSSTDTWSSNMDVPQPLMTTTASEPEQGVSTKRLRRLTAGTPSSSSGSSGVEADENVPPQRRTHQKRRRIR
eukprot:Blabericola_migrator_1__4993@NODE_2595_length_2559_cov_148_564607_g1627_i0_p1_GENE_NODE_2595_length_2559_cov_148_564607_g1627_i0NODE_2595_length_2559_cov_148_564607_g1627_i0_p1_ORF_typecomplete_len306_score96_02Rad21_Rec8/PF04824_16/1e06SMC_ScpA/PF02616_14/0_00021Ivy/PF08816_11/0_26Ivy/PF08816_11/1_2e04_NODE_2595_length_2559_cov_148_564607_g1627_i012982215